MRNVRLPSVPGFHQWYMHETIYIINMPTVKKVAPNAISQFLVYPNQMMTHAMQGTRHSPTVWVTALNNSPLVCFMPPLYRFSFRNFLKSANSLLIGNDCFVPCMNFCSVAGMATD